MSRWQVVVLVLGVLGLGWGLNLGSAEAGDCIPSSIAPGSCVAPIPASSGFASPQRPEKSLLDRAWYARLSDNVNVYAEPSHSAPIVRNVGDGFLFVTLMSQVDNNGETWYQINYGEYVYKDDLTIVNASKFSGVEVLYQPVRPFGWFVADWRPSSRPGGDPDPNFERLPRYTFFQVYDAVVDDEDWIWYNIGRGRWIKQTYVSVIDVSPRPAGIGPDEYWVQIDLYEQNFAAYQGDRMVYASLVSSGLNRWPTDEGIFHVWDRWRITPMDGAQGKIDYYDIEDVPYTMFFDDGIALHGAYWHDRFGYKHSHGCVNMPPRDAEWVFLWSENSTQPLAVSVVTSDPHDYFMQHGHLLPGALGLTLNMGSFDGGLLVR